MTSFYSTKHTPIFYDFYIYIIGDAYFNFFTFINP